MLGTVFDAIRYLKTWRCDQELITSLKTEYTKLLMFYITKEYLLKSQIKCSTSAEGEGLPGGQAELNLGGLAGFDWLG